jgi:hypothetical protein
MRALEDRFAAPLREAERDRKRSADASVESARTVRAALAIEQDRRHEETRPVLEGHVEYVTAAPGRPDSPKLVVELESGQPLARITLTVPSGSPFGAPITAGGLRPAHNLSYPPLGNGALVRVGVPAWWLISADQGAHGTVTAVARCRNEDGTVWEDVPVPISLDGVR